MPNTGPPDYTYVVNKIYFSNGAETSGTGGRRVTNRDEIKAQDINSLREAVDLMFNHEHSYTDEKGGC